MMRVLLVSDMYAHPDRAISATFFHRQAVEVRRLGVDVQVLCPLPALPDRLWRRRGEASAAPETFLDGIKVTRVHYPKILPFGPAAGLGSYLLERTLRRHILQIQRNFDFDLLHGIRLFPIVASLVPVAAAMRKPVLGLGVGSDVHTHPLRSRGIKKLTRRAIERSDRVAAVSRALASQMAELVMPPHGVACVYNGVDQLTFCPSSTPKRELRARLALPESGLGVIMVSRLVWTKGLRELGEAFGVIAARWPEAWLAVVGDGPDRAAFVESIRGRGLESRVYTPGARSHSDLPRWLNAADVFVLPSYKEGLPNVVLEAMACGLPVVSTDVGGTGEAVVEGETGYLVPPRSAASLLPPLEALLEDRRLRERMGKAARARAVSEFGWRQSGKRLVELYEETVRSHRDGSGADPIAPEVRSGEPVSRSDDAHPEPTALHE
jgi:teichuronic acid biosynthesis glycosyltransferase TuaC